MPRSLVYTRSKTAARRARGLCAAIVGSERARRARHCTRSYVLNARACLADFHGKGLVVTGGPRSMSHSMSADRHTGFDHLSDLRT